MLPLLYLSVYLLWVCIRETFFVSDLNYIWWTSSIRLHWEALYSCMTYKHSKEQLKKCVSTFICTAFIYCAVLITCYSLFNCSIRNDNVYFLNLWRKEFFVIIFTFSSCMNWGLTFLWQYSLLASRTHMWLLLLGNENLEMIIKTPLPSAHPRVHPLVSSSYLLPDSKEVWFRGSSKLSGRILLWFVNRLHSCNM